MTTVFQAISLGLALGIVPAPGLARGPGGPVRAPQAGMPGPSAAGRADRPAAETGFLDISSDPPAKIVIDDQETGKLTPQPHLELKVGHHKLTLQTPDGTRKRTIGFNIQPGATTTLTIHLAS